MKNRTYRYFQGVPLYPFGYGLTYSHVVCRAIVIKEKPISEQDLKVEIEVQNIGARDTEEVIQVYVENKESAYAVANTSLCGFKRIFLKVGEVKKVSVTIPYCQFEVVDNSGKRFRDNDHFILYAGLSQPDKRSVQLTKQFPVSVSVAFSS